MKKDSVIKLIVLIVAFVLIAVMVIVYFVAVKKKPIDGEKTVTLEIAYKNKLYRYENIKSTKNYLAELLHDNNETLELGFVTESSASGEFVTSFKNTAQDFSKGYYYMYTVNGEMVLLGISSLPLADGDVYRFEYGKSVPQGDQWVVELVDGGDETATGGDGSATKPPMSTDTIVLIVFGCVGGALVLGVAAYLVVGAVKKRKNGKQA